MNWNEFAKEVHQLAVEKGWYDPKPSFAAIAVNFHCELSEAVEEYRKGMPMLYYPCNAGGLCEDDKAPAERMDCGSRVYNPETPEIPCKAKSKKPCGVAVELADCILRIMDTLAAERVNIDSILCLGLNCPPNDLAAVIAKCHALVSKAYMVGGVENGFLDPLLDCIELILDWAAQNGVDMESVLRAKHEYNKTRPCRHGGKKL